MAAPSAQNLQRLGALLAAGTLRIPVQATYQLAQAPEGHADGRYGSARVSRTVLLGPISPFLLKRDGNPEGVDRQVFEDVKAAIVKDRYAYFKDFVDNFYNVDVLAGARIS
jgi:hypothetical protein